MPSPVEVIVYTNAARMAPQEYRDKYMAGFVPDPSPILRTYSSVEPVYYEPSPPISRLRPYRL